MLIADPLREEAAFIAAAVREGTLSARGVAALVHARAGEGAWHPGPREQLLARAEAVDRRLGEGAALSLAGVPFVVSGAIGEAVPGGLDRAGAFRVATASGELRLGDAIEAVARGVAGIAAVGPGSENDLSNSGAHVLQLPDKDWALLARSCRDLALAADAAATGGGSDEVLCRPVTGAVGRGVSSLRIGALAEIGGIALPASFRASVEPVGPNELNSFDAVIFTAQAWPTPRVGTRIYLPAARVPGGFVGVAARSTDVAVRVGSAIDASLLVQG